MATKNEIQALLNSKGLGVLSVENVKWGFAITTEEALIDTLGFGNILPLPLGKKIAPLMIEQVEAKITNISISSELLSDALQKMKARSLAEKKAAQNCLAEDNLSGAKSAIECAQWYNKSIQYLEDYFANCSVV